MNEDVCLYVPAFTTSFKPRCVGYDCSIPATYERFIKALPNPTDGAAAFVKFSRANKDSFTEPRQISKSFPWTENGKISLATFIKHALSAPKELFRIEIDRNTPTTFEVRTSIYCPEIYNAAKPLGTKDTALF